VKWLGNFKIGIDKDNLFTVGRMVSIFRINPIELCTETRDVRGYLKKVSLDKKVDIVEVFCSDMSTAVKNELQYNLMKSNLIFLQAFETGEEEKEDRTSISRTSVKIMPTSKRFITITSVVLASAPTGTNYYTGGSFDEETYLITLGASLPDEGANQAVIVSYNYKGWKGSVKETFIEPLSPKKIEVWSLGFKLTGI